MAKHTLGIQPDGDRCLTCHQGWVAGMEWIECPGRRQSSEEMANQCRDARKYEAEDCSAIAQAEGDRLLACGDDKGSQACWKVAALIRQRVDKLSPF